MATVAVNAVSVMVMGHGMSLLQAGATRGVDGRVELHCCCRVAPTFGILMRARLARSWNCFPWHAVNIRRRLGHQIIGDTGDLRGDGEWDTVDLEGDDEGEDTTAGGMVMRE
ncbi:predicted protein [Postia placenta Mad-698-R]|nr:predicted protein [Postia placenta Mad-698-R]